MFLQAEKMPVRSRSSVSALSSPTAHQKLTSAKLLTKDEKNEKDIKVAISGLEVGDIIDYS